MRELLERLEEAEINYSIFKTGDTAIDKVFKWLLDKSDVKTYRDGTIFYFFQGRLPKRMVDQVVRSKSGVLKVRDAGKEIVRNWSSDLSSVAFTTGAYKSTQTSVKFGAHDYTVPAEAER